MSVKSLLVAACLIMSSCQHFSPLVVDVAHCAQDAVIKEINDQKLIDKIWLSLLDQDWNAAKQEALAALISASGAAGLCAWEAVRGQILSDVMPVHGYAANASSSALLVRVAAVDGSLKAR